MKGPLVRTDSALLRTPASSLQSSPLRWRCARTRSETGCGITEPSSRVCRCFFKIFVCLLGELSLQTVSSLSNEGTVGKFWPSNVHACWEKHSQPVLNLSSPLTATQLSNQSETGLRVLHQSRFKLLTGRGQIPVLRLENFQRPTILKSHWDTSFNNNSNNKITRRTILSLENIGISIQIWYGSFNFPEFLCTFIQFHDLSCLSDAILSAVSRSLWFLL